MATVKVKPHYLGLLNGISVGEGRGGVLLQTWAGATCDEQLKETLTFVAGRECDHSEVFAARVCELGFEIKDTPDTTTELCAFLASDATDAEKIARWNTTFAPAPPAASDNKPPAPSIEDRIADPTIDRTTRTLLRWYIDEEIDSGRRLREAFARVVPAAAASTNGAASEKPAFLGLLNQIAVGEGRGGQVLDAWVSATCDDDLKACLSVVAARENNHRAVFKSRIEELGYTLQEEPATEAFEKTLAFYAGDAPDCEKVAKSQAAVGDDVGDGLGKLEAAIAGPEYDPVTRRLLTWFIGEERDSTAKLNAAYAAVMSKVPATA